MIAASNVLRIAPQPGPQEAFLANRADVVLFGGSAGGGKSAALIIEPLRHLKVAGFGSVTFRRTFPQITAEGGLWDESAKFYAAMGAIPNKTDLLWKWPNRVKFRFAQMQHEKHMYDWQGSQIPLICWDELTHFAKSQFFYMFSRNRSMCGVKPYIRATTNPEPNWVADFIEWWIDQDTGYAIEERSGVIRYFIRGSDETITWADDLRDFSSEERENAKSFTFIKSSIYDNKLLLEQNPDYLSNLKSLPLIERERLLNGNWKIRPSAGKIFNRAWFPVIPAFPRGGEIVRFWDFAATEKKLKSDDPDFSATVKMLRLGNAYYILDCQYFQLGPADIDKLFVQIALQDASAAEANSSRFSVRWEEEGGASGKRDSVRLVSLLSGIDARGIRPQGDKITRAKGLSAQSEAGNVMLLLAQWNEAWLVHMHNQPDMPHDDIMDASSGAFNSLTNGGITIIPNLYGGL